MKVLHEQVLKLIDRNMSAFDAVDHMKVLGDFIGDTPIGAIPAFHTDPCYVMRPTRLSTNPPPNYPRDSFGGPCVRVKM
ncbi:MAG: hypothetical protein JWO81_2662 [Alphaproteobacteria bacterium]|nr:hypothetical protein [Alphaproteobacteria bacterium]